MENEETLIAFATLKAGKIKEGFLQLAKLDDTEKGLDHTILEQGAQLIIKHAVEESGIETSGSTNTLRHGYLPKELHYGLTLWQEAGNSKVSFLKEIIDDLPLAALELLGHSISIRSDEYYRLKESFTKLLMEHPSDVLHDQVKHLLYEQERPLAKRFPELERVYADSLILHGYFEEGKKIHAKQHKKIDQDILSKGLNKLNTSLGLAVKAGNESLQRKIARTIAELKMEQKK